VLNHTVEFVGDGTADLPCPAHAIANMTTEWGALAGVFPFDEVTVSYMRSRISEFSNPNRPGKRARRVAPAIVNRHRQLWKNRRELSADADAEYAIELELDLATVVHMSGPNEVKTMVSLPEMQRKHVSSKSVSVVVRECAF